MNRSFLISTVFYVGVVLSMGNVKKCKFENVAIILDSTKLVTKSLFESMKNIFVSNLLDLMKYIGGVKAIMSVRVYYQDYNCSYRWNLTEDIYFPPMKGPSPIRDALKRLKYQNSTALFNCECAEKLLMSQYDEFGEKNKEKEQVGMVISGYQSVQPKFPHLNNMDYAVFVYDNEKEVLKQTLKGNIESTTDLVRSIISRICINPARPTPYTQSAPVTISNSPSKTIRELVITTNTILPTTLEHIKINVSKSIIPVSRTVETTNATSEVKSSPTVKVFPHHVSEISSEPEPEGTPDPETKDDIHLEKDLQDYINKPMDTILEDWKKIKKFLKDGCHLMSRCDQFQQTFEASERTLNISREQMKLVEFLKRSSVKIVSKQDIGKKWFCREGRTGMRIEKMTMETFGGVNVIDQLNNSLSVPKDYFQKMLDKSDVNVTVIAILDYATPLTIKINNNNDQIAGKSFSVAITSGTDHSHYKAIIRYALQVDSKIRMVECVHWRMSSKSTGEWSSDGCQAAIVKDGHVFCKCYLQDTTLFTVKVKGFSLNYGTYIGCGIAAGSCIILLLIFLLSRHHLQYDQNGIHFNLTFAIAAANGLFVSADFAYRNEYICMGVSIGLMFFYLATFSWILVEAIHLHMKIVRMAANTKMIKYYMVVGWLCPAVVVAIIAGLKSDYFRQRNFCWLSYSSYIIWAFVGMVICIIFVSIIILARSLSASFKMESSLPGVFKFQRLTKIILFIIPHIGLCWSFSLMSVNEEIVIYQYVLTALNILVGAVVFFSIGVVGENVKKSFYLKKKSTQSLHSNSSLAAGKDIRRKETPIVSLPLSVVTDKTLHSQTNF